MSEKDRATFGSCTVCGAVRTVKLEPMPDHPNNVWAKLVCTEDEEHVQ